MPRCESAGGKKKCPIGKYQASVQKMYPKHVAASWCDDDDAPPPAVPRQERRRVRVYYMAVPPFLYSRICRSLQAGGMRQQTGRDRFVLEKPFGRDAQSCASLCRELASLLREDEAYRIDHYLGKELVMNVLVLRFANAIFEAVWSRRYVERVEICCLEEVDCRGRGGYFDAYGIIRDVMQNHLAQLLALVAMEQPLSLKADDVRREKVRALRACKVLDSRDVIRGQYDGYADDSSITNKKTTTETFAACKLFVDTYRTASLPTREFGAARAPSTRRRRPRAPRQSPVTQAALGRRPVHPDRGQGPPGEEG